MKKIEFETSKGVWCVTDGYDNINGGVELKTITEEQASEVVEQYEHCVSKYKNYLHKLGDIMYFNTPIESLHSLLKSKGIHLYENPAPMLHNSRLDMESKTFYNPYIFKVV